MNRLTEGLALTAMLAALLPTTGPALSQTTPADSSGSGPDSGLAADDGAPDAPDGDLDSDAGSGAEGVSFDGSELYLSPISILGTRWETLLLDVPRTIDIVPQEELQDRQVDDIEELVRYLPGVAVERGTLAGNPYGEFDGFTIRGVGGNRVQVLVDGSRTQERITDFGRDFVDPNLMGSVEILRGPSSVLWGADAIGGVVLFNTLLPDDILDGPDDPYGGRATIAWDSYDNAFTESIVGAAQAEGWQILAGYTRRDAEEPELGNAEADGGVWEVCPREPEAIRCDTFNPADYASNQLLGTIIYDGFADQEFRLTGEFFERQNTITQLDNLGSVSSGGVVLGTDREQDLTRYRLTFEHVWTPELGYLDRLETQFTYHPQQVERFSSRRSDFTTEIRRQDDTTLYSEDFLELDIQAESSFEGGGVSHTLVYGFDGSLTSGDYETDRLIVNETTGAIIERTSGTGFNFAAGDTTRADFYLQDEIGLFGDVLTVTPGFRYATYEIEPNVGPAYDIVTGAEPRTVDDDEFLPSISVEVQATDALSFYASYSEGFKMPTAQQLFQSVDSSFFVLIPNPTLLPETAISYEIGARALFEDGFLSASAYTVEYENFIQNFVETDGPDSRAAYTYDNLSSVELWGIELSGEWAIDSNWTLMGAASYQHGNQQTDESSPRTPYDGAIPFNVTGGLRWESDSRDIMIEGRLTYQDGVSRTSDEDVFRPGDYLLFDVIARYSPLENFDLTLGLYNITDARYFASTATRYDAVPSSTAVAAQSPIELAVQPGFTVQVGATLWF